tara:strand:- start:1248 stop:1415 length:168 start_codon:yes stop_codon:yes gene_type:complete
MMTDTTEPVELDITDEQFLLFAKAAHKEEITLNHWFERAITTAVLKTLGKENDDD